MNKKGFTLIELMVYVAVFVIAATMFTLFVLDLIKIQTKTRINKEVLEASQRAMEIMLLEIRHAQNIYLAAPGQLSLETTRYTPDDETVTYIDFYLDNERLCLKKEELDGQPVTPEKIKITTLVFNHLTINNNHSIRIELTAEYNGPADKPFYQAATTLISSADLRL